MSRILISLWILVTLAACAQPDSAPTAVLTVAVPPEVPTKAPLGPVAAPTIVKTFLAPVAVATIDAAVLFPNIASNSHPQSRAPQSMEQTILAAEVVARVSYLSKRVTVAQIPSSSTRSSRWATLLEFRFSVHEYLKGSGGNEIGGIVYLSFHTEAHARAAVTAIADAHDSRWDSREAIVFLDQDDWLPTYPLPAGSYWFGRMFFTTMKNGRREAYTVASIYSKLWLPATQTGGTVAKTLDAKLFLLDAPGSTGARGAGSAPAISLNTLKGRITDIEAEATQGGTPEYRECVEVSYRYENGILHQIARRGPTPHHRATSTIASGLPAGTVVYDYQTGSGPSRDEVGLRWFNGPDKDLVDFVAVDFRPSGPDAVRFTWRVVTARPLPPGDYLVYPDGTWHGGIVCARYPEIARKYWRLNLTVASGSTSTLHEALFDPVGIGDAVGADASNGRLDPAAFSLKGTSTTITSLKWENGAVTMALNPSASLTGYVLDFIDTTGTTILSLSSANTTSLTWAVPEQPWADGDLLMLRVRE